MSYIFFHHLSATARATAAKSRKHQFSPVLLTLFFLLFFPSSIYSYYFLPINTQATTKTPSNSRAGPPYSQTKASKTNYDLASI